MQKLKGIISEHRATGRQVPAARVLAVEAAAQKGLDQVDNYATPAEHKILGRLTAEYVLSAKAIVEVAQNHRGAAKRDLQRV